MPKKLEEATGYHKTVTLVPVEEQTVSVRVVERVPHIVFTGTWTGRDVRTVRTALYREYIRYQRDKRRSHIPNEEVVA